jgi:hypothetical protein
MIEYLSAVVARSLTDCFWFFSHRSGHFIGRERGLKLSHPSFRYQFSSGTTHPARTSPSTTTSAINQNDQKRGWQFFVSFTFGSLGVMLATAPLSPRWSFTLLDTRIQFRSMFVATLFLFIFLFLGQYPPLSSSLFPPPFLFRSPSMHPP